jgi:hypothetical protein
LPGVELWNALSKQARVTTALVVLSRVGFGAFEFPPKLASKIGAETSCRHRFSRNDSNFPASWAGLDTRVSTRPTKAILPTAGAQLTSDPPWSLTFHSFCHQGCAVWLRTLGFLFMACRRHSLPTGTTAFQAGCLNTYLVYIQMSTQKVLHTAVRSFVCVLECPGMESRTQVEC